MQTFLLNKWYQENIMRIAGVDTSIAHLLYTSPYLLE